MPLVPSESLDAALDALDALPATDAVFVDVERVRPAPRAGRGAPKKAPRRYVGGDAAGDAAFAAFYEALAAAADACVDVRARVVRKRRPFSLPRATTNSL